MSFRPWLLSLFIAFGLAPFAHGAPRGGNLPFGTAFLPRFGFSERYTEDVRYSPEDEDFVDDLITYLNFSAEVSMQGISPTVFDDETVFSVDVGNLFMELAFDEGVKTVSGGTTTIVWTLEGTHPITFETIENAGTVTLVYNANRLTVDCTVRNVPDDFNVIAPDEAGGEDDLDDFPLILEFAVGDYGFSGRTCYVNGTASLYDKTVGTGDNQQDFVGLAKVILEGEIDITRPALSVTDPPSRQTVNERPITVKGTASDDHSVPRVEVKVNDGPMVAASFKSTTAWELTGVPLVTGDNTLLVRATDPDGNSREITRIVRYSEISELTVTVAGDGSGKVSSPLFSTIKYLPGQPAPASITEQPEGRTLKLVATPGADAVFDGWTTNRTLTPEQAAAPELTVPMVPNLALTANFLKNPFMPVQGKYAGLIKAANPANRGSLTGKLTALGAFSLKAQIGKLKFKLKGQFSNTGQYTAQVVVKGVPYVITLVLNVGPGGAREITGSIVGGTISATVDANLSGFSKKNPAPPELVGTFNVLLPPAAANTDANFPAGVGFGRVTVKSSGSVKFTGKLGDATALTAGGALSKEKIWPFFGALYGKKGSVGGEVVFDPADPGHDLGGTLDWFKPAGAKPTSIHPEGFTGQSDLAGAKFVKPAPGQLLFLAPSGAGQLLLTAPAAGADAALTGVIPGTLGSDGRITFGPPASGAAVNPKFQLDPKTGLFAGSFEEAGTKRSFSGAVAGPKLNRAGGLFLRGTRTGSAAVTP